MQYYKTQVQRLCEEFERRSVLAGRAAYITIREIEEDLKINGAYTVLDKVRKKIDIHEDNDENLATGEKFKIYRKAKQC